MKTIQGKCPREVRAADIRKYLSDATLRVGETSNSFAQFVARATAGNTNSKDEWVAISSLTMQRLFACKMFGLGIASPHVVRVSFYGGGGLSIEASMNLKDQTTAMMRECHTRFDFGIPTRIPSLGQPIEITDSLLFLIDEHSLWSLYPLMQVMKTLEPFFK